MAFSRRTVLATAGSAALSGPITAVSARSAVSAGGGGSNALVHRILIGNVEVIAIGDGHLDLEATMLPAAQPEEVRTLLESAFLPVGPVRTFVNAFVVNVNGRRVLIDAGIGGGIASSLGRLLDNLAAADITPAGIDTVLLTHLHRDHVRGLSTPDGIALFPNAEIMVHEAELAFWTDEKEEARAPAIAKPHFTVARAALKPYARRISTFAKDTEILKGIQAVHAPGHTPGHTLYRIVSGSSSLLIAGDIVHMPALQFAHPDWSIVLDVDQVAAGETRRRILDATAVDRGMIAGMHFHFPAFGHVQRDRQGYQFAPALWQTGL